MHIRPASPIDCDVIAALYRRVARLPGGLARLEDEISEDYVAGFVHRACERGIILVAVANDGALAGEIHAYRSELFCFAHVLGDLTIAVDPGHQSAGVGRQLFTRFMELAEAEPDVLRIELVARESNRRALAFYNSLGFVIEGDFRRRIRNPDGSLESDVPMAWIRP
jgi:putative acetyltransferase